MRRTSPRRTERRGHGLAGGGAAWDTTARVSSRRRFLRPVTPVVLSDLPPIQVRGGRASEECPYCGRRTPENKDGSLRRHRVEADNPLAPYCDGAA